MKIKTLFILLLTAFLLAACGGEAEKPTIKLAENPWTASALNVQVAKIIIEQELGYPVEIVSIDENPQWAALSSGELHASLEVWPSGHADNVAQYIDNQGTVEHGGNLGPVGKIGWYTPAYMLESHPELATWEGFTSDTAATLYATAETGDKGQFLTGPPSWTQYDQDIMNNLGINFEVVQSGSEEAIVSALDSAVSRQDPLLFYFWTPHSIHAKYDLVEVALPDYSEDCYAKIDAGGVDCDYPADVLFKIFSSDLSEVAPDVHQFLRQFSYPTEEQIKLIAAVELDGKTVEETAQEWVNNNEATWRSWLPN
ncbi:MAG TPA: ABC transporter substrate-binding protein [Anaerolineae bacterium]|nr:ABC transporter substrate-binding protein [Anaerolineae bacterium]